MKLEIGVMFLWWRTSKFIIHTVGSCGKKQSLKNLLSNLNRAYKHLQLTVSDWQVLLWPLRKKTFASNQVWDQIKNTAVLCENSSWHLTIMKFHYVAHNETIRCKDIFKKFTWGTSGSVFFFIAVKQQQIKLSAKAPSQSGDYTFMLFHARKIYNSLSSRGHPTTLDLWGETGSRILWA